MQRTTSILISIIALLTIAMPVKAVEKLNRGLVAVHKSNGGNFVSWRLLPTDAEGVTFDLLCDGKTLVSNLSVTSYTHSAGTAAQKYQVLTKAGGQVIETSTEAQAWNAQFKTMTLDRPAGGSFSYKKGQLRTNEPSADSTGYYSYYPLEAAVADADGDGEWEVVVKWNPTSAKDNSEHGYTGSCILDCYHLNPATADEAAPQRLWRIDLGPNIRAGSHYTQFLFYDFNGDGRAEMICKTAPGSVDGEGRYVSEAADDATIKAVDNAKDWRTSQGRIMDGPEFLTVFDGQTGRAIHTIWYNPNRAFLTGRSSSYSETWGDSYGNRGERFLACVAHLDGQDRPAQAVMCRGYYTRAYLWAVDFDGSRLSQHWLHASVSKTRVEVTDANGQKTVKTYSKNTSGKGDIYTAYGQGCHSVAVGDVDGDGCDEIMYGGAAIDLAHRGSEFWSAADNNVYDLEANVLSQNRPSYCFRIYWDGTLRENLLDGQRVKSFSVPDGFSFTIDRTALQFTLSGTPQTTGTYEIVVRSSGDITGNRLDDTLRVVVTDVSGIQAIDSPASMLNGGTDAVYDLQGRRTSADALKPGLYIVGRKKIVIK